MDRQHAPDSQDQAGGGDRSTEELENTARQERSTHLEDAIADRTVGELREGAERAAEQPDYGREGS